MSPASEQRVGQAVRDPQEQVQPLNGGRRAALMAGAGLTIGFFWPGAAKRAHALVNPHLQPGDAAAALADGNPAYAPNAFVRIGLDGSVRLVMPMAEMGQGVYTGSAMLLAEELGVDLDQVQAQHAPPSDELYGMKLLGGQITGGSTSTRSTYTELRQAGAVARTRLVQAAALRWRVDAAACTAVRGAVHHAPSGRQLKFGELALAAAKLPDPKDVRLKPASELRLIGRPMERVDSLEKVKGAAQFGIDVRLPGMKIATVRACPTIGGTLARVNDARARQVKGVVDILRIGNAVAVVADHYWAAKTGLEALEIEWHRGPNSALSTEALFAGLNKAQTSGKSIVAKEQGRRPEGAFVTSTYKMPMLAHATMEPLNATVHFHGGVCEIWAGSQVPVRAVQSAAKLAGLPREKVLLHNQYLGGGFGRRLENDYIDQAVLLAKQVRYPLKVVWSREEDIKHDIVRPPYHDVISAAVDSAGWPHWFGDRICSPSVLGRWMPAGMRADGLDGDAVESAVELPYAIPNFKVEWVPYELPPAMAVGWWRGVGPLHNLFVVESFFDELAHRARKDPVEYRRKLLERNERSRAVLDLAAHRIGWGGRLPARVGRGVAVGQPFGSHICAIVEVEVTPLGEVLLRKAVVAVDCGVAVNVGSIEAQLQGGLLFGLSAALFSQVTLKNGEIQQSNFNDYRVLRLNETPSVDVHIVPSDAEPGGIGELGTAIAAPALTNAIFAATGVRLRELPVNSRALVADPALLKKVGAADLSPDLPSDMSSGLSPAGWPRGMRGKQQGGSA